MIKSINPATEDILQTYEEMPDDIITEILQKCNNQYLNWKKVSIRDRSVLMKKAAGILRAKKKEIGKMMTLEMGKIYTQSLGEVEKCAWACEHYAENTEKYLSDESVKTDASKSYVTYEPLGVILAIMPWNFPLWQVIRFAAPALMAGNGGVLKHASNVTGTALLIEEVFKEAGFPEDIFRTLVISSAKVEKVINDDIIKAVTLTGSVAAGKSVASSAGKALKKTVLELGGSDPYIILKDADIEMAADTCVISKLINSGQSCIAAKRFIAVDDIYDKFEELFVHKMSNKKMGDPFFENTELGPLSSIESRNLLHEQIEQSIKSGAQLLTGGVIPDMKGAYYPATILKDVKPGMPAYEEELFGPVASLIRAKDEEEAIFIANDTIFGLGAAVFTSDLERGEKIAKKINAGSCFVNDYVKSDPRLPFGGVKESGYGRELSYFGIREFVNTKTVYIR